MNLTISGFLVLAFALLASDRASAYQTYKCEENYQFFFRWYMEESNVFFIRDENIQNLPHITGDLADELKTNVTDEDFCRFCRFYNDRADKNVTYSPCNDQRYDVNGCFRRFIQLLNENVNVVIERYIEHSNTNYGSDELSRRQLCNYTLNNERAVSSIRNHYERQCIDCVAGLQSRLPANCSSVGSVMQRKCCKVGRLLREVGLSKLKQQLNVDQVYGLNNELIAGKYGSPTQKLRPSKQICRGAHSPKGCVCPKGYLKSDSQDCFDQDECDDSPDSYCSLMDRELNRKYNLGNRNLTKSLCVNTFGSFLCVRIECPANYELKNNKCYYIQKLYYQLKSEEKFSHPKIIAFDFISLPKNVYIERGKSLELFRIDNNPDADHHYKINKVNSIYRNMNELDPPYIVRPDLNRDEADLTGHFSLKHDNSTKQAILYLTDEINSLVEAQVILLTSWHSYDKKSFGITNIVLNIYVTN